MDDIPTLDRFLALDLAVIAKQVPATVGFAPGGSRRQAAFLGMSPQSLAYMQWARAAMNRCLEVLFRHGVQHVVTPVATPTQLREKGTYGAQFFSWVKNGLIGPEALADYQRYGWRVRLLGSDGSAELEEIAAGLVGGTGQERRPTVWWSFAGNYEEPWDALLAAVQASGATSRAAAIEALYGEAIPPASMFISFGKPLLNPVILPPLLIGELHGYWLQRPGYTLDDQEFRRILYDYVYVRRTWREDKTGRAEEALTDHASWEQATTLGLGRRLGPFWYPATPEPAHAGAEACKRT